eukprot:scaffold7102_cov247-Pinguiococcus_pyrenoidosus.AAC.2
MRLAACGLRPRWTAGFRRARSVSGFQPSRLCVSTSLWSARRAVSIRLPLSSHRIARETSGGKAQQDMPSGKHWGVRGVGGGAAGHPHATLRRSHRPSQCA